MVTYIISEECFSMHQMMNGYIKDPKDKHALLVGPEAADVVKQIFAMYLARMPKRAIV